jgi:hypothetical protein
MKAIKVLVAMGAIGMGAAQAANPPASLSMVPDYINYQGRLVQPSGLPYSNVNHTVELRLFETASGGAAVWGESYVARTQDGYFSINLGTGGTSLPGLTSTLWRVIWSQGPASARTYFMGMTVKTDPQGNVLAVPQEATPRQQFLTAPFAFRSFQSTYADRSIDEFQAPAGISTPQINSTGEITVAKSMRITGANNALYTSRIWANDASDLEIIGKPSRVVEVSADNSSLYLGQATPAGLPTALSSYIQMGHYSSTGGSTTVIYGNTVAMYSRSSSLITVNNDAGTLRLGFTPASGSPFFIPSYGPTNMVIGHPQTDINIQGDNFNINSLPMFDFRKVLYAGSNDSDVSTAITGIDLNEYYLMVVGFTCNTTPSGVFVDSAGNARVTFAAPVNSLGYVYVMGVRKVLMIDHAY